jgi:hypothetical protein
MNIKMQIISKIGQMPEVLIREVNDYIDFLLWRDRHNRSTNMTSLDSTEMVEYETRLANGEIKW